MSSILDPLGRFLWGTDDRTVPGGDLVRLVRPSEMLRFSAAPNSDRSHSPNSVFDLGRILIQTNRLLSLDQPLTIRTSDHKCIKHSMFFWTKSCIQGKAMLSTCWKHWGSRLKSF